MSGHRAGLLTLLSRGDRLAFASVVAWLAAAACAGIVGVWVALGGAAVALGLTIAVFDRPTTRVLLRTSVRHVLWGLGAGSIMIAATDVLYPLLARLLPFIKDDTAMLYAAFRAPPPLLASLALVPVIVGEELVWRGAVQSSLAGRLGAARGVALAALLYALVHTPLGSPVLVLAALLCGLAWGALRSATASLVPTVVAHLLWNVFVLLWRPLDGG